MYGRKITEKENGFFHTFRKQVDLNNFTNSQEGC